MTLQLSWRSCPNPDRPCRPPKPLFVPPRKLFPVRVSERSPWPFVQLSWPLPQIFSQPHQTSWKTPPFFSQLPPVCPPFPAGQLHLPFWPPHLNSLWLPLAPVQPRSGLPDFFAPTSAPFHWPTPVPGRQFETAASAQNCPVAVSWLDQSLAPAHPIAGQPTQHPFAQLPVPAVYFGFARHSQPVAWQSPAFFRRLLLLPVHAHFPIALHAVRPGQSRLKPFEPARPNPSGFQLLHCAWACRTVRPWLLPSAAPVRYSALFHRQPVEPFAQPVLPLFLLLILRIPQPAFVLECPL